MSKEISKILSSKGIEVMGEIKFKNETEEINFLNKFDKLKKDGLKISFLNQNLVDIFTQVEVNKENISKINKTNWEDFEESFRHENDKRAIRINKNFLNFLRFELDLLQIDLPLTDKSLLGDDVTNKVEKTIDYSIFSKKDDFDMERDKVEKAKKFGVNVLFDYTEPSRKLTVQDFTLYFNKRLQYFTELLENRISSENVMRIDKLVDLYESNTQVTVIGLISEINQTKNGHWMITLEDRSSSISCFINKDKEELVKQLANFCLDEGIAIKGKVGKEIIWVDDFIIPSPPNSVELKKTDKEEYIAFISDIHFGAKVFVDEAFQKFVDFLNCETNNPELNKMAKKIKYIVVPGDLIEGIGIYPNQGKDARILSTEMQYHEAARWLSQIPKDKCIILIPGNHDTDRLSEPQPKLPYEKAYALYNMPNVISLSNPSIVKLFEDDPSGGLELFLYHGGSIFYYADKIQSLRDKGGAKTPDEVIAFLLEKRHLAPSHGSTLYIPDNKSDPLVIRKMPDIFATGHTHKLAIKNYKGCTIVSCGCWVEMSDYQEKMGMFPDIGKCTIINTQTRKPQIMNFYTEKYKLKEQEEKSKN